MRVIGNCRSASVDEQKNSFFFRGGGEFSAWRLQGWFFFSSFALADFQKSTATHPP